jgi:hypothetical protein
MQKISTIGLIVAMHLVLVKPVESDSASRTIASNAIDAGTRVHRKRARTHKFTVNNRTPDAWLQKTSSWDTERYKQWIREAHAGFYSEDLISWMFGYFDPDELTPVSKSDKKQDDTEEEHHDKP